MEQPDLFEFQLDGPRPLYNLSSGWARRKRKLQAGAIEEFTEFDQFVLAEALRACKRRAQMTGYAWSVDHMVPLARNGKHTWHNLQVIPAWLNSYKQDRMICTEPGEWVSYLPGAQGLFNACISPLRNQQT
jgi:hypothetical protein